ncbi:bacillithiol biosynthesis cysteine-adding enzyme BshC [Sutcliffiella deserti]|uniref:bacillithiol biosynthesis cysteine-adding enzyme BshC n=1 Tax=Sutcliffiella deserti TaxID=2875501 RepID=UPI001CC0CE25|nr:bacillithiol biosynthesis cysteine-adding enzyme BshC [Sutcliffiella deserti]
MNIVELSLPTINKFSSAYLSEEESIHRFFTYNPFSENTYEIRKNALTHRSFRRDELSDHLLGFNEKYQAGEQTLHNIEKLRRDDALVVVAGQQAGLLTGPLYTISKIISIIKLAEEQESKLGVPVLPVFWIAGEDHDYQEINHINVPQNNNIEKIALHMKSAGKKMISELDFHKGDIQEWVNKILHTYGETPYTKDIKALLNQSVESSSSLVDFFAHLITNLFKGTGLILVNASDPGLRKLETPYFHTLLSKNREITAEVTKSQNKLVDLGHTPMLEVQPDSMNIFYHLHEERELLYWNEASQTAITKNSSVEFSLEELYENIEKHPERFSNNVVTRPIMEEFLFPTLAFIGGPGEISYWAELENAFKVVNLEMPPVVPRLSFTIVERHIDSTIRELGENLEGILKEGLEDKRKAWLAEQELDETVSQMEQHMKEYLEVHHKFKDTSKVLMPHLQSNFEKNWNLIDRQFLYIKRLLERSAYEKHENIMKKYHRVELALVPNGIPQERVWNIYYYLNEYGLDLVNRLCEIPMKHNGKHKVVFI